MITRIELEQALARGYCADANASKELDATLIVAMADEVMQALEADRQKILREIIEYRARA